MLTSRKILAFTKKVADLPDTPSSTMTAGEIKGQMDAAPEELRAAFNGAMDDLSSTTPGSSGAEQIGSAPILGVAGSTPYAQIADVKAQLNAATTGGIPDGSITPAKLSFDVATQAELNAHTGATTGIHGATSAATANTLALRDASGRLQVAAPSVAADAVTKGYADGNYSKIPRTGSYTGDGAASRDIALPFTPSAVYLNSKENGTYNGAGRSGLALNGSPLTNSTDANYLLIGTNKFTVYGSPVFSNVSGDIYYYIAFP